MNRERILSNGEGEVRDQAFEKKKEITRLLDIFVNRFKSLYIK